MAFFLPKSRLKKTKKNMNKILVIVAHPDDEVLGCGCTISKYSQNSEVFVLILGEGITSRYDSREKVDPRAVQNLKNKSIEAGRILGVRETMFLDLPDQRFDVLPFLEIVKRVEEIINRIKPDIIYTHSQSDLNLDHRICFNAVLTASRPKPEMFIKEIISFEIPSSTEWSFGKINGYFCPNVFESGEQKDIEKKLNALRIYESEMRQFPHPRSEEAILSLGKTRGSCVGVNYAEAFELIRRTNN